MIIIHGSRSDSTFVFVVRPAHIPPTQEVPLNALRTFASLFVTASIALAGCGGDDNGGTVTPTDTGGTSPETGRPDEGTDTTTTDTSGGDTGGDTAAACAQTVTVGGTSFTFSPSTVNVKVGDTVCWTWAGAGHSVTSGTVSGTTATPDGKFDSTVQGSGATFSFKFTTAGTFPYYCQVHFAAGMVGSVVVAP
jgi:plastocyanin